MSPMVIFMFLALMGHGPRSELIWEMDDLSRIDDI
jgi:hypothetical protein